MKLTDMPIAIGSRHQTLCDIEMLVYDYDSLPVKPAVLPAGSIFQPWEPLDHWRGNRVPITLGDSAKEFDWGVSASEGHFLRWDDFFTKCSLAK
jgi:hypothetical protein